MIDVGWADGWRTGSGRCRFNCHPKKRPTVTRGRDVVIAIVVACIWMQPTSSLSPSSSYTTLLPSPSFPSRSHTVSTRWHNRVELTINQSRQSNSQSMRRMTGGGGEDVCRTCLLPLPPPFFLSVPSFLSCLLFILSIFKFLPSFLFLPVPNSVMYACYTCNGRKAKSMKLNVGRGEGGQVDEMVVWRRKG